MNIIFADYTENFLELSQKWLSDPEIKRLTMTPDFDRETQQVWFNSLKFRDDYYIKGVIADDVPIGAVGIKHISYADLSGEYWGYIGEKDYIGHGIGKYMVGEMCSYAKKIGLKELYLNVAEYNIRAYNLYKIMGFNYFGTTNGIMQMKLIFDKKILQNKR